MALLGAAPAAANKKAHHINLTSAIRRRRRPQMARVVDDLAARTPGKKSLAMAAFGRALRQIPTIICDNAGVRPASPRLAAVGAGWLQPAGAARAVQRRGWGTRRRRRRAPHPSFLPNPQA